jgi:hypothetical protein
MQLLNNLQDPRENLAALCPPTQTTTGGGKTLTWWTGCHYMNRPEPLKVGRRNVMNISWQSSIPHA